MVFKRNFDEFYVDMIKLNKIQKSILKIGVLFFICFGYMFWTMYTSDSNWDISGRRESIKNRALLQTLLIIFQMILWLYVWRTSDNHSILRTIMTLFIGFIVVDHLSHFSYDLIKFGGFYYNAISQPIQYLISLFKPSISSPSKIFNFVIIMYSLLSLYKQRKSI